MAQPASDSITIPVDCIVEEKPPSYSVATDDPLPSYAEMTKPIEKVPDYFIWSIVNLLFGVIILGICAVCLSMQVRRYKNLKKITEAKNISGNVLGFNIITTVLGHFVNGLLIFFLMTSLKS